MDTAASRQIIGELASHEDMMNDKADTFARFAMTRLEKCRDSTLTELKKRLRHWDSNKKKFTDKTTR